MDQQDAGSARALNQAADDSLGAQYGIAERCRRFARKQGFPYYLLILHLVRGGEPRQIVLSNYPKEWTERYDRQGYVKIDPIVQRLLEGGAPFAWDSVACSAEQRVFFADAARCGLVDGFSVPVQRASGEMAALCLAGARVARDRELRDRYFASALLFAVRVIDELRELALRMPAADSFVSLTPRQKDILTQIANGASIRQAAERLALRPRTVEDSLRRAAANLGVATREEAIVRAVLCGLIAPLPHATPLSAARDTPAAAPRKRRQASEDSPEHP